MTDAWPSTPTEGFGDNRLSLTLPCLLVKRDFTVGLCVWAVTGAMVLGAGLFGWMVVKPRVERPSTVVAAFAYWDGGWYVSVLERGYGYDPAVHSNVAFFPAYPLAGAIVERLTGWPARTALLVVSQFFMLAALVSLHGYLRHRFAARGPDVAVWGVLIFATFPPTFFFRMAYSESLFFFVVALTLLAVERKSPLWVLAFLVGLATGCRPVGAGLVLLVVREIWIRSKSWQAVVGRGLVALPLSLWGLLAYAGYLWLRVGDPLAFVAAQSAWNMEPPAHWTEKVFTLLKLEPIWGSFFAASRHFFPNAMSMGHLLVSASAMNAVVYLLGLASIAIGMKKRWLNGPEVLAAVGLLAIPYITRGFDSYFLSFARFTSVVLPIYIPITIVVSRWPTVAKLSYLLLCAWLITLLTALFTAGYHLV